jgi:hypothetical protein
MNWSSTGLRRKRRKASEGIGLDRREAERMMPKDGEGRRAIGLTMQAGATPLFLCAGGASSGFFRPAGGQGEACRICVIMS